MSPLFVRVSAPDWVLDGWDIDACIELARWLKADGVDPTDTSSGGNVPHAKIPVGPGYQVPFAARIRREAGIATGAVGLIVDAKQAQQILDDGDADLIIMAREFLRDPYFPRRAGEGALEGNSRATATVGGLVEIQGSGAPPHPTLPPAGEGKRREVTGLFGGLRHTARNSARPLLIVSSHSFCGSES